MMAAPVFNNAGQGIIITDDLAVWFTCRKWEMVPPSYADLSDPDFDHLRAYVALTPERTRISIEGFVTSVELGALPPVTALAITPTTVHTGARLHEALRQNPADQLTRFVYADWLEENGHLELASRQREPFVVMVLHPDNRVSSRSRFACLEVALSEARSRWQPRDAIPWSVRVQTEPPVKVLWRDGVDVEG
jgi:uncharacterized protein (TIGR02996 family)